MNRDGERLPGSAFPPLPGEAAALSSSRVERWLTADLRDLARMMRGLPGEVLSGELRMLFLAGSLGVLPTTEAWRASTALVPDGPPTTHAVPHEDRDGAARQVVGMLVQANVHRRVGQYPLALVLAERAEKLLDRKQPAELLVLVLHECGVNALLGGDVEGARQWFERAFTSAERVAPAVRRYLGSLLALVSALAGELLRADELLAELSQVQADVPRRGPVESDAVTLARLLLHLDRWDLGAAESLMRTRAPATFGWLWPVALFGQVQHALITGRHLQGLRLVAQAEQATLSRLPDCSLGRDVVREARASLHAATGDLRSSWDSLEHGRPRGMGCHVAEVAVLYCSGEVEPARYLARAVLASHRLTRRQRSLVLGLEAGLALAEGGSTAHVRAATLVEDASTQRWRSVVAHLPPSVLHRIPLEQLTDVQRRALSEDPAIPWIPAPAVATPVSPRERVVLDLLVEGAPRTLVAERLDVSVNTVKTHVRHLYAKLGVRNRAELVRLLARLPRSSTLLEVDRLLADGDASPTVDGQG